MVPSDEAKVTLALFLEQCEQGNRNQIPKWKVILPHVGLVALLVIYILIGATIFYVIENPHETRMRNEGRKMIENKKKQVAEELWQLTENPSIETYEQFEEIAQTKIDDYLKMLYNGFANSYVSNTFDKTLGDKQVWTFPAAVMFSATTLTTIGYGTPCPATNLGRMFCVIYGLFGIPLTLVTVADLAKFLGSFLQSKYKRIKKMFIRKGKRRRSSVIVTTAQDILGLDVPMLLVFFLLIFYPIVGAICVSYWENWPYFESFYFCFISVFTIGFGDFSPSNERFYLLTILFVLVGLIITTMSVDLVASQYIDKVHYCGRKLGLARERARKAMATMATNAAAVWHSTNLAQQLQQINMIFGLKVAEGNVTGLYTSAYVPRSDYNIRFADDHQGPKRSEAIFQSRNPPPISDITDEDGELEYL